MSRMLKSVNRLTINLFHIKPRLLLKITDCDILKYDFSTFLGLYCNCKFRNVIVCICLLLNRKLCILLNSFAFIYKWTNVRSL